MSESETAGVAARTWPIWVGMLLVGGLGFAVDPLGWFGEDQTESDSRPASVASVVDPVLPAAEPERPVSGQAGSGAEESAAAVVPSGDEEQAGAEDVSLPMATAEPLTEIAEDDAAPVEAAEEAPVQEVAEAEEDPSAVAPTAEAVDTPSVVASEDASSEPSPAPEPVAVVEPTAESAPQEDIRAASGPGQNDVQISASADPGVSAQLPSVSTRPLAVIDTAPNLPEFDLVRVDASGVGLVAGRAEPGSRVRVLSNGSEIATAEADARGEFVAFIQTPASDEGQVLSLIALSQSGDSTEGGDQVVLLPVALEDTEVPSAPAVLRKDTDSEAVRVVEPGGLGKVSQVTLDAITYTETGDVVLSGRVPRAQALRIYVDSTVVKEAQSRADGTWDAVLGDVDAGRYVLRVDALAEDGGVESRVESPFQRVFPTAEERASLSRITVQPGNTLWVMAEERYGSGFRYTQIFAANRDLIRDPDLIYPGQIFSLPEQPAE